MDESDRKLRYEVINFFLRECRPPTIMDLMAKELGDQTTVISGLKKLRDLHHLKLYEDGVPSLSPITMAHPFSHLPSPYLVKSQNKSWWANCAWCALGLASMLAPEDATVHVLTASGECVRLDVVDGELVKDEAHYNYRVVFSAAPSQWWKDVRFACSGIQICTSEDEAQTWHESHGFPVGDFITLDQLWKLSKDWYHDKHHYDYQRKSTAEKEQLFRDIGLVSSYWSS